MRYFCPKRISVLGLFSTPSVLGLYRTWNSTADDTDVQVRTRSPVQNTHNPGRKTQKHSFRKVGGRREEFGRRLVVTISTGSYWNNIRDRDMREQ